MSELTRKHQEDLLSISQVINGFIKKEQGVAREIEIHKQTQYQLKLTLWELRNEIMDLGNMLVEEEAEEARLTAGLG